MSNKTKEHDYVPLTPGGSVLLELMAHTEQEAWENLLEATSHMPYGSIEDLKERGYEIWKATE